MPAARSLYDRRQSTDACGTLPIVDRVQMPAARALSLQSPKRIVRMHYWLERESNLGFPTEVMRMIEDYAGYPYPVFE